MRMAHCIIGQMDPFNLGSGGNWSWCSNISCKWNPREHQESHCFTVCDGEKLYDFVFVAPTKPASKKLGDS